MKPHPVVAKLGLPLSDRGRIVTDEFLQVQGHDNVWAIGDAASVPDPAKKYQVPSPPTAQHAVRQGKTVGRNVAAAMGAGKPKRFDYKTLGVFVDMGRGKAVAETVGIRWRGRKAWLLARSYHLALMPGVGSPGAVADRLEHRAPVRSRPLRAGAARREARSATTTSEPVLSW